MGFCRHEYWSGLPFPTPGDLPNPGIKPASPASPALAGRFFTTSDTWEAPTNQDGLRPNPVCLVSLLRLFDLQFLDLQVGI